MNVRVGSRGPWRGVSVGIPRCGVECPGGRGPSRGPTSVSGFQRSPHVSASVGGPWRWDPGRRSPVRGGAWARAVVTVAAGTAAVEDCG